ncbi:MAG: hypothetical protein WA979_05480 [Pacificimonas sp.]
MSNAFIPAILLGALIGLPILLLALTLIKNRASALSAEKLRRFEAFTAVLRRIEAKDIGPVEKIVAVRQLREFPEYSDLTVILCNSIDVNGTGQGAEIFQNELNVTEQELLRASR